MKRDISLVILTISFFISEVTLAQHYTPPPQPVNPNFMMYHMYYPNGGMVSMKHHFKITFKDGKDTIIYSKLNIDTTRDYFIMINKAVGKKDSARQIRIYPSQTKSVSRIDIVTNEAYEGSPNDSCWIFPVIDGKMKAYSRSAENIAEDAYVQWIQVDNSEMITVADPKALPLFIMNARAYDLFAAKKYAKAVKKFNKAKD
ncbi:MAG TPA: hypothetical protein VK543_11775 [Puia sp.]|nr:hypothetical protein [Puia sp.]